MMVTAEEEPRRATSVLDLSAAIDFATRSHARALAALILVSLLAFLPGFFQIPPVDRDEARFAQATKQMLESDDYVDIRFQDETRYKKPVGIYWLQAAVVKTAETIGIAHARTDIWLYRIPSLLGAVGGVLLTYWTALAFVSRRAALFAGLMLASSILLGVEARLAKTDAMLLLTIVAAMGSLGRIYLAARDARPLPANSWLLPAIFWTALAAGECGPEDRGPAPRNEIPVRARMPDALPRQIRAPERAHGGNNSEQQHGVGLGEPRLDTEQHRCCHHQAGKHGGTARHEGERCPIGQQHGAGGAEQRRDTIERNCRAGVRDADRFGRLYHRRLQPIDPDRLLVTVLILEADVHIVVGLDHLLGGLGKPRLVAIDRRDLEKAGQKGQEADGHQQHDGATMGTSRERHCGGQAQRRLCLTLAVGDQGHGLVPSKPAHVLSETCANPAGTIENSGCREKPEGPRPASASQSKGPRANDRSYRL